MVILFIIGIIGFLGILFILCLVQLESYIEEKYYKDSFSPAPIMISLAIAFLLCAIAGLIGMYSDI